MGEEAGFLECGLAAAHEGMRRDARKLPEQHILAAERQRDERRARLDHPEAELAGEIVGEAARAQFGDARPASGDGQRRRSVASPADPHLEQAIAARYFGNAFAQLERHVLGACGEEHRDDLPRRAIAEELAQRLFMPGDAMRIDQGDEIVRRVTL